MTLDEIDLLDGSRFATDAEAWFEALRRTEPVHFQSFRGGTDGFWSLTKHADVVAAGRDWATFSSEGADGPGSAEGGIAIPDQTVLQGVGTMMLMTDPPRHTRYRKLVSSAFTPGMMAKLEGRVRAYATRAIDSVIEDGECDLVSTIAAELPLFAIAELIGIPEGDRHRVYDMGNRLTGSEDIDVASLERSDDVRLEFYQYANWLAAQKREQPGDDLLSNLIAAELTEPDGSTHSLSELEVDLFFLLLSFAGNETTRNAISHGVLAFSAFPDQRRMLLERPNLITGAVEETLRWASPVLHMRRTATRDVTLRGKTIRRGQRVVLWYLSANRDEEVFVEPTRFDITRHPNNHLAFGGGGAHFCLGASLARLELKVLFEELFRRVADIEPAGEPELSRQNFVRGINRLPVRFTPARRPAHKGF